MKGIVPSLNTPFDANHTVDHGAVQRLVSHTIAAGCGGMLGLAVAGEHTTLSLPEKAAFIDTVVKTNAQRIPFIVSVTSPDLTTSVALTKIAKDAGVAGICVQIPDGLDLSAKLAFLQELASHAPDIVMVQDLDWAGTGLSIDDIVYLFDRVAPFSWLKIETQQAGPKYSAVMQATDHQLNVCGGWAVAQLMDAMARGVNAFIPTGMERVYVEIFNLYQRHDPAAARRLFNQVLPILNFSNQHIDTSILFFKRLRQAEGLFDTANCRIETAGFDPTQVIEAEHALAAALELIGRYSPEH